MSTQEPNKKTFYVWTKTERIGQIVEVAKEQTGTTWLEFTDGTRCNASLVSEMLMHARDEAQANSISKDFGGINFLVTKNVQGKTKKKKTKKRLMLCWKCSEE